MTDKATLHHGDCLEVMPTMPENSVDLTVTSPPYDNLRTYNDSLEWGPHVWKPCIESLFRITKPGGVVVWIVADATIKGSETGTSFRQALHAMQCGFRLHDTMIWDKDRRMHPMPNRCYDSFEYMFVLSNGAPDHVSVIKDMRNIWRGKPVNGTTMRADGTMEKKHGALAGKITGEFGARTNVWRIGPCKSNTERTGHPAQFPEALARDHIISWSNEGDTVLDPFTGSGTTGAVAVREGRKFIGIEKVYSSFEIARRRIEEEERRLF